MRRSDFVTNKVGMEYEERDAADAYVGAESKVEPISTMKQAGAELCELCACAPCQCDKMKKTGGTGNDPFEVRRQEGRASGSNKACLATHVTYYHCEFLPGL